jgi:asparagine synthase (glutamine-hydrolysing)
MCGINGIAYTKSSGRTVDTQILRQMRDVLTHRGPDEEGIFVDRNIGFGHRRLSIVDLQSGQQPMMTRSGHCVITYNGEIYNHADFRDELISRGHAYTTRSDTEAILHLYEEYGVDCLDRFRGMFAFAIWDKAKEELFIARDRFGVKPLYYYIAEDGSFYFASEIKALFEAGVPKELNYSALPDQLANHGTSYDETLFMNVKRLLPGNYLKWKEGRISVVSYWDLSFEPKYESRSDTEYVE